MDLFPDCEIKDEDRGCLSKVMSLFDTVKKKKLHKISYTVNSLPFIGEHVQIDKKGNEIIHNSDKSVMQMCINSG